METPVVKSSVEMRSPFRKWFPLLILLIGFGVASLIYLLSTQPKSLLSPVLSDQVSFLPLIRFEFKDTAPSSVGYLANGKMGLSRFLGKMGKSVAPSNLEQWKEHVFHGKTLYQVETGENNETIVHAVSQATSSLLFQEINVKRSDRPFLTWEWKAIRFPSNKKNEILASKSDNDFAARVYAVFQGRTPLTSHMIQYVWDDYFPDGTYVESPYSSKVKIVVVQSGRPNSSDGWVREKRDLVKDYEMLYGNPPRGNLIAVGLMSDSDNTGTVSEAYYRRLSIEKPKN